MQYVITILPANMMDSDIEYNDYQMYVDALVEDMNNLDTVRDASEDNNTITIDYVTDIE